MKREKRETHETHEPRDTKMDSIDLSVYLREPVNTVEIYWLPQRRPEVQVETLWVDIGWPMSPDAALSRLFGNGSVQKFTEFHHRDLTYIYDLANDGQRAYRRVTLQDQLLERAYVVALQEENVPPHKFPCVQEIQATTTTTRTVYRINNRMYVLHDRVEHSNNTVPAPAPMSQYIYIRYQHAPNVDLTKMQTDLQRTLGILKRVNVMEP